MDVKTHLTRRLTSIDGQDIYGYTIGKKQGFHVEILSYGAIVYSIYAKNKVGVYENVVLNYQNPKDYVSNPAYLGATIGRTAGRIADGCFEMDHQMVALDTRDNKFAIHGGADGFSRRHWQIIAHHKNKLVLTLKDSFQNGKTPGDLTVTATFSIEKDDHLRIIYRCKTTEKTYVNMTNHSYFNLSGGKCDIGNHQLTIPAKYYLQLNNELLPIRLVESTGAFDFTKGVILSNALTLRHPQYALAKGIDHPFILSGSKNDKLKLYDVNSGRQMTLSTNQKSVVVYSGNYLTDVTSAVFKDYSGICFECQAPPNELNLNGFKPQFTTPKTPYLHTTDYLFSVV